MFYVTISVRDSVYIIMSKIIKYYAEAVIL